MNYIGGIRGRWKAARARRVAKKQAEWHDRLCPECWMALDFQDDWMGDEYDCIGCDWHGTNWIYDKGQR